MTSFYKSALSLVTWTRFSAPNIPNRVYATDKSSTASRVARQHITWVMNTKVNAAKSNAEDNQNG